MPMGATSLMGKIQLSSALFNQTQSVLRPRLASAGDMALPRSKSDVGNSLIQEHTRQKTLLAQGPQTPWGDIHFPLGSPSLMGQFTPL